MTWVITIAMIVIFVPNIVKLFSVSANLLGIMPAYLRWVGDTPGVLEDEETRSRLRNSFTQIFLSIQTHAINAVVCILIGWFVLHGRLPTLSTWIRGFVSGISIANGFSNVIFARYLIKEFLRIREIGRAFKHVHLDLELRGIKPPKFTSADVICVWASIGLYVVSAISCTGLAYFVWS